MSTESTSEQGRSLTIVFPARLPTMNRLLAMTWRERKVLRDLTDQLVLSLSLVDTDSPTLGVALKNISSTQLLIEKYYKMIVAKKYVKKKATTSRRRSRGRKKKKLSSK